MGVAALHLDLFEQPGNKRVFQRPARLPREARRPWGGPRRGAACHV